MQGHAVRYFEDLEVGEIHRYGNYAVTREETVEFAGRYDPQPFHLDDAAAAQTHFGRLAASGWHTCAMTMAMYVEYQKEQPTAVLGGAGVDSLRWVKPVYPGDTLSCQSELVSKRRSQSKPALGITQFRWTTFNQHGETVLEMVVNSLIATRDAG